MEIIRNSNNMIIKLSSLYPVLVLTGPRQSGKTTLLKTIFKNYNYISLDLPSIAESAERNPEEFLKNYPPPVIIDEVQYAPSLFRYIKIEVDKNRETYGSFILTGSQSFPLMKGVSDSLAGRCVWKELENLSLDEIISYFNFEITPSDWNKYIARGLFPELWKRQDLPEKDFLLSYLSTYLERDVRQILNVGSLRDFERFIRLLAVRSGNLLNKSDLARDTGISVKTAGEWLSVLEASGQVSLLEPWFENLGKRIVKTPKVYFRDTGLLCFILSITKDNLTNSPLKGNIWETFVISEIRKAVKYSENLNKMWFYRDQSGRETDIIIESGGILKLVEIKWCENPDNDDVKNLHLVSKAVNKHSGSSQAGSLYCICRTHSPYTRSDSVRVINPCQIDELFK